MFFFIEYEHIFTSITGSIVRKMTGLGYGFRGLVGSAINIRKSRLFKKNKIFSYLNSN